MLLFPQQLPTPGREATIRPVTATPGVWSGPGHLMPRPAAPFVQPWAQHSSRESALLVLPSLLRAGLPGGAGSLQRCQGRRRSGPPSPGRQLLRPVLLKVQHHSLRSGALAGPARQPLLQSRRCGPREESGRKGRRGRAGALQRSRQAGSQPLQACQQQLQTCRQPVGRRLSSSSSSSLLAAELLPPLAGRGVGASARPQWLQQQMLREWRGLLLSPASAPAPSRPSPASLPPVHRWRLASAAHLLLAGRTRCGEAGSSACCSSGNPDLFQSCCRRSTLRDSPAVLDSPAALVLQLVCHGACAVLVQTCMRRP